MKIRIAFFSVLAILLSVFASCTKKPETIVSELYSSVYNEDWEKAIPMILPDSIEGLNPDEINFLGEEFGRYFPKERVYKSVKVDSASYNDNKDEIEYTATVLYNDSTSFTEKGNLKKNADGIWKLTDYMPEEGEKIPFEITIFDFPMEMKPNLKRAMIMLGAERKIPKYQYYAAPYYLFAPYPVDKEKYVGLIKQAAEANYIPAMIELADRYCSYFFDHNKIMSDDYLEWTKRAAALGDLEAKARMGWYQRDGSDGVTKDLDAAQRAFQEAYDAGISEGAVGLGYMYGHGEIGKQDRAKALEYYKEAAELGNLRGAFNVCLYYERGWGTKRNVEEGRKLEQEYKDKVIGFNNRNLYEPDDPRITFETTLLNIKHGDPSGYLYNTLGNCYELGKGVTQNIEKAKGCYLRDAALSSDFLKQERIRMRGFEKNPVIPMEEFKEIYK